MKRKHLLFISLIAFSLNLSAQSNFYRFGVGAGGGSTFSFTDVYEGGIGYGVTAIADYNITPFISAGLEIQKGMVKGGNRLTDPHMREFTNSYSSVGANFKFRAGEVTDYYYNSFLNAVKGFYLGTGLSYAMSNMTSIVRVKPDGSNYVFPGQDKGASIALPVNVGIDFFFPDGFGDIRYVLNINYQTNFVFADNLDGYNDPSTRFKNLSPDIYTYFSVGVKFNLGPMGFSSKSIR